MGKEEKRQAVLFWLLAISGGASDLEHSDACLRSPVEAARRQSEWNRERAESRKSNFCDHGQGTCLPAYFLVIDWMYNTKLTVWLKD